MGILFSELMINQKSVQKQNTVILIASIVFTQLCSIAFEMCQMQVQKTNPLSFQNETLRTMAGIYLVGSWSPSYLSPFMRRRSECQQTPNLQMTYDR